MTAAMRASAMRASALALALASLGGAPSASAQTLTEPPIGTTPALPEPEPEAEVVLGHVMPPESPTRVEIGLFLRALDHVDPPSQVFPHFSATVLLTLRWRDPRVAFDGSEEGVARHVYQGPDALEQLRSVWHPDIGFENEDGERHVEGRTLIIRTDGTVVYEEMLSSRFRAHVKLRRFPFDTQRFHVAAESLTWNVNKVQLVVDEDRTALDSHNERGSFEWRLTGLQHRVERVREVSSGHPYARATFELVAERTPGFYLWKLIVPLLLIVMLTWSTFWMSGEGAPTRMQRAFIALLSIVAYHHVVSNHLPRIPYLTFMDSMVYLAFAFTGATVVQIIVTYQLDRSGRAERALKVDRVCRWAFPLVFVVSIVSASTVYGLHL
jgi:hypothetical protein